MTTTLIRFPRRSSRTSLLLLCLMLVFLAISAVSAEQLTLQESIDIALQNNPAVRIADEGMRKADATVREALCGGYAQSIAGRNLPES
jgi:outer membrane protein TolC